MATLTLAWTRESTLPSGRITTLKQVGAGSERQTLQGLIAIAFRHETVILRRGELRRVSLCANLAHCRPVPSTRKMIMATASKSSGGKARKSSTASKRAASRGSGKAKSKSKSAAKRSTRGASKAAAPRKKPAIKRSTKAKRATKKQSPVTRIRRVATTVIQQGATAAKQGVQAVERLVEEVKDRVTS
jgi:hypothetical protein